MIHLKTDIRVRDGVPYTVILEVTPDAMIHALIDRALRSKKRVARSLGRGVRLTVKELGETT